ncbi:hypothetical protein OsI_10484 [Oryza sativa Indica Group]|uniref:Uncharacterized protein n=1 Tax=Oryza sativa subsp. indica TaxID=39946 RepID=A2XDU1_ORYSI|nr:hypothetical protein OsI_10484 [Oryza sativa Indica Group]
MGDYLKLAQGLMKKQGGEGESGGGGNNKLAVLWSMRVIYLTILDYQLTKFGLLLSFSDNLNLIDLRNRGVIGSAITVGASAIFPGDVLSSAEVVAAAEKFFSRYIENAEGYLYPFRSSSRKNRNGFWYSKPGSHGYLASDNFFGDGGHESEEGDPGDYIKFDTDILEETSC